MLLPLTELRLMHIDNLDAGCVVLPVKFASHDSTPSIVVDGGDFKAGKMLLPLGGNGAFVPQELRDTRVVALTNRNILVRFSDLAGKVPDKYESGQISVDEDAAYIILKFRAGMRDKMFLLNLLTWKIEEGSGMKDPAFWPAKWELVARSDALKDDFLVATYPSNAAAE